MPYPRNPLTGKSQPKLPSEDPRIVEAVRDIMGVRPKFDTELYTGNEHLTAGDIADEIEIDLWPEVGEGSGFYRGKEDPPAAAKASYVFQLGNPGGLLH